MNKKEHLIRFFAVGFIFCAVCLIYLGRLVYLQVAGQDYYATTPPPTYYTRTVPIQAHRGEIYDRNGVPLVTNAYSYTLQLDYGSFPKTESARNELLLTIFSASEQHGVALNTPSFSPFVIGEGHGTVTIRYSEEYYSYAGGKKSRYLKLIDGLNVDDPADVDACAVALMNRYELLDEDGRLIYSPTKTRKLLIYRLDIELSNFSRVEPYDIGTEIPFDFLTHVEETCPRGIRIHTEVRRHYNYPGYASHILGLVSAIPDSNVEYYTERGYALDAVVGISGAEYSFEAYLRGVDGVLTITEDNYGNIVSMEVTKEPVAGNDVYLTIDIGMQIAAENALAKNVQQIRDEADPDNPLSGEDASSGALVATDVDTGELLAIASYPTYDLSSYNADYTLLATDPTSPLLNRALRGTYAPGSTFKVGVAVAALSEEIIEADTLIDTKGQYTYYKDFQPACWIYAHGGVHGAINVTEAIQESCNYFFFEVGRLLTIDKMNTWMEKFGLGLSTGIELYEETGILAGPEYRDENGLDKWSPGDTLAAAIGQSDNLFTPLQMNMYLTTLLNRGTRYSARLLYFVKDYDKTTVYNSVPKVLTRTEISDEIFAIVKQGMRNVMDNGSAARIFAGYPIPVGGKTGTAQVYTTKSDNAIMSAFAPYDDPAIAVTCVIEQGYSGTKAGYAIKDVFDYYFGLNK
ncbi:MAG: hypothetical protein IJ325_08465 [Clostridia bacterium]|nr:hypothetical protein [Clostridia bacterium]